MNINNIKTQKDLAKQTGLKQPHICGYLKDMEGCDVLRKPIKKILKAQGKWYEFEKMWAKLIQK
jgi:hypothetical protein